LPSDSSLPTISVQDVSITYRTTFEKRPTFKSAMMRAGRGERLIREVEAVKGVSFEVHRGSVLGIIGNNGAGKSTLVRAIAGILPPTKGRIEVRGRVSTLLALGVGFNASLSGHENVILGGLAAGYSRAEIEERFVEIGEWSELGDFLEMPMRTYSSGMFSRLAFSVAIHMNPDILLVDEALSAGDAGFKKKATAKMNELVASASTMVLVSHALGTIEEMCTDAIWLQKGELLGAGKPVDVIKEYRSFVEVADSKATNEDL
jgi:lipopolysaccharide transport system ATP-binding protein/teichoic acid transport system ATP-binding protein